MARSIRRTNRQISGAPVGRPPLAETRPSFVPLPLPRFRGSNGTRFGYLATYDVAMADGPAEKWTQRIASSGIREIVPQVREELMGLPRFGLSEDADVGRLVAIVDLVGATLDVADPVTVSESALSEIQGQLTNIRSQLEPLRTSSNLSYLGSAMAYGEAIVNALPRIAVPRSAEEAASNLRNFKLSLASTKAQTSRQFNEVRDAMSAANGEMASRVESLGAVITNLSSRADAVDQQIQSGQQTQRASFDEAQSSRSSAFDKLLQDQRQELQAQTAQVETELRASLEATGRALEEGVRHAEESDSRIDTILGIVAEKGLVAEYTKSAKRERTAAMGWRVAAGVVSAGAVIAGYIAATHASGETSWRPLVSKLAVTVLIGAIAAYCGSVANDHRKAELHSERTALQLAAIKPYLNDLTDDATRNEVLASIALRLFAPLSSGNEDQAGVVVGPGMPNQLVGGLADDLLKALVARVK